jgi:hypothetical protein
MKTTSKAAAEIAALARKHSRAAIRTLAQIMKQADGPATARVSAAQALLDRGWGMRGNYFGPGWYVIDQLMEGMNGPDPTVHLADGNFMYSGCRIHSCDEKSAVIVTPEPKLLAAALIHFHCRPDHTLPRGKSIHIPATCDELDNPHLTIFVKKENNRPELVQVLREWAMSKAQFRIVETRIIP